MGGLGHPAGPAPTTRGVHGLELAQSGHERGPQEDRRPEAPRSPTVRVEDGRGVAAAEPTGRVEFLPERDVVHALGQDRLKPGVLGTIPLAAQRTAGLAEGVREVNVRVGADRQAGHGAHRRPPGERLPARTGGVTMGPGGSGTFL